MDRQIVVDKQTVRQDISFGNENLNDGDHAPERMTDFVFLIKN
jgi:hypothetical protein